MASTTALIATATAVASSTANIQEAPEWVSYIVDIVLALVFLYILLFTKAEKQPEGEQTSEEKPNEFEKYICTDEEYSSEDDEEDNSDPENNTAEDTEEDSDSDSDSDDDD